MTAAPEELFWNDPKIVQIFSDLEVPPYWRDFFLGFPKPGKLSVLDLGCGGGRITEFLARTGFLVWAADAHAAMVEATRRRLEFVYDAALLRERVVQTPMTHLPFPDAAFDVVVANGIYHNAGSREEFEAALRETARVLGPSGSLCLNVFYAGLVDADVRKDGVEPCRFLTAEGLPMILLPEDALLELLRQYGLNPVGTPARYESSVATGNRSVFRGVFTKTG